MPLLAFHSLSSADGNIIIGCAAALGLLAFRYNDRAIFTERRKGIFFAPTDPLVGGLLKQLNNKHRLHDYLIEVMEKLDVMTL